MHVTAVRAIPILALLAFGAAAQDQDRFIDMYVVKVKPEKRADFDAMSKKMAEANRKNKGDRWLAYESVYGETDTVVFGSSRKNYAATEAGMNSFDAAMKEAFGPKMPAMMADFEKCINSGRAELRRRRWDLAINMPDSHEMNAAVGHSRYLRVTTIRVRPGQMSKWEEAFKIYKDAHEKNDPQKMPVAVSVAAVGMPGSVVYLSSFVPNLAAFDDRPTARTMLGEGYDRFVQLSGESSAGSETDIYRWLPQLSNPPDEIASADPAFWNPKPAAMPMKPKPAAKPADSAAKSGL